MSDGSEFETHFFFFLGGGSVLVLLTLEVAFMFLYMYTSIRIIKIDGILSTFQL